MFIIYFFLRVILNAKKNIKKLKKRLGLFLNFTSITIKRVRTLQLDFKLQIRQTDKVFIIILSVFCYTTIFCFSRLYFFLCGFDKRV